MTKKQKLHDPCTKGSMEFFLCCAKGCKGPGRNLCSALA
ncbi:hypothetical protein KNP414_00067 [Paenibacillus mucilaginosus KNP414]|uniref:Uncharacterized protein n=1 Tax=Paenibacillus mucilaginosus (strain KNP414) TaxID=1036673 RepID=F8FH68_PAEMK|nr:hypothetical protein KNP414_00067 [Paenibacillus mucilaginosus KNP414]